MSRDANSTHVGHPGLKADRFRSDRIAKSHAHDQGPGTARRGPERFILNVRNVNRASCRSVGPLRPLARIVLNHPAPSIAQFAVRDWQRLDEVARNGFQPQRPPSCKRGRQYENRQAGSMSIGLRKRAGGDRKLPTGQGSAAECPIADGRDVFAPGRDMARRLRPVRSYPRQRSEIR
jgi:hypothetical protein